MGRVRQRNTKPELAVRRVAHALGYRFRLHGKNLPGRPDIVFPGRKKVVFVHGCFWHSHSGCRAATIPKTRTAFWVSKFRTNRDRDCRVEAELSDQGWGVLVMWECETRSTATIAQRLQAFLEEDWTPERNTATMRTQ